MNNQEITVAQLKRAIVIREKLESLESELQKLLGTKGSAPGKRSKMSAAGRAKIAAAQRKRWAKVKGKEVKEVKPRRKISPAARKAMAAAAKARWARAKAEGKNRL